MAEKGVLLYSNLPYPLFKRGKVKDVYDLNDKLLIVFTDRISAFDVVLPNGIPHKGQVLNKLSLFWFKEMRDLVDSHVIKAVNSRSVLAKKSSAMRIEFIVRGYLYGSAWENYRRGRSVSGVKLPPGLQKAEKLPEPILTPTTKEEVGHDVELTKSQVVERIGVKHANQIEDLCLKIYERGSRRAESNGIIIADTKIEFGLYGGEVLLIDELLTPDSSRFWPREGYKAGADQLSLDKQYVRDYLASIGWDGRSPPPALPDYVVAETSRRYVEIFERLTGEKFFAKDPAID